MATVIIQGNSEENNKVVSALKSTFVSITRKTSIPTEKGNMLVVDVSSERVGERHSLSEIDFALLCCSSIEKRCTSCPYVNEADCKNKVLADGALMVSRLFNK